MFFVVENSVYIHNILYSYIFVEYSELLFQLIVFHILRIEEVQRQVV